MDAIKTFRHITPFTVRFADLDVLQHLNHATYLTYMEQARIRYMVDVIGWDERSDWRTLGMILGRAEVDYKLPVAYGETVQVYTRISRIGGKSFDFEYILTRQQGEAAPQVASQAKTLMVAYDYAAGTSVPVPDDWREAITSYEPALNP